MTEESRLDLALLMASQCNVIQQDVLNRALSGRSFTDTAINDTKRILAHLIKSIEERK